MPDGTAIWRILMAQDPTRRVRFGLTEDGIEQQFAVNHVAHQYLAQLLLPLLKASQPSSIVSVSSNAAFFSYDEGVRLSKEALNNAST